MTTAPTADRPAPSEPASPARTLRGMAFMLISVVLLTTMNAGVRWISDRIHPFEVAFFRSLFSLLVFVPVLVRHGLGPLRTARLFVHGLRGGLHVTAMLANYYALALVPFAMYTALTFTTQLFTPPLAALFLRETMRTRRIAALLFGFAGALAIVRPGFAEVTFGAALVLFGSVLVAGTNVVTKGLARTESSVAITLYIGLLLTPLSLPAALLVWTTPSWEELAYLAAIGITGGLGFWAFSQSLREADIVAVLPISFTSLLWAAIIGFLLFGEIPDIWIWTGGAMIFLANLYLAWRERRQGPHSVEPRRGPS